MNKFSILLSVLVVSTSFAASDVLEQCIQAQQKALPALESHRDSIGVKIFQYHSRDYSHTHAEYNYPTLEARISHTNYGAAHQALINTLMLYASGYGFATGSLAALVNKLISGKTFLESGSVDKRVLIGALVTLVGLIIHQNSGKQVPYINPTFLSQKQDNLFANFSGLTIGRMIVAAATAGLSFVGADYLINKLSK